MIPIYKVAFRSKVIGLDAAITLRVPESDLRVFLSTLLFNRVDNFTVERETDA